MLLNLIKDKYKTISIVGMSKNSGKTVALNHLINEAEKSKIPIGITSIGRDGEFKDIITELEKPRIYVDKGTIIASTEELLKLGSAEIEILRTTDFRTPLGNIIIGKVKSNGNIEIGGPQTLAEMKEIIDIMHCLGAEIVIMDGALDRRSSAAPTISEATILSTGAVLSRDMNKVVEQTLHAVKLFNLPAIEDKRVRDIMSNSMNENKIELIDKNLNVNTLSLPTAIGGGKNIGGRIKDDSKYLVIPGSLVKDTIEDIIYTTKRFKYIDIVVNDGTKIFIDYRDFIRFQRLGVKIKVLHPIDLIGITVNPYSPTGYSFDPIEFLEKMQAKIKDIPIVDCESELCIVHCAL
ncbi:lysine 5,6-aminomutase reactivase subunit KamB [Paratissierella segnis]|uniref:Uncharacterized protein n=1 Tax=Paratissierella segnis TaxID=2763679 RepID=A0A926EY05_9FIRM|nr:hypothetical protein [Paratissierella segnis]MBC8588577.1 hypothetical protein [Paratissierella segnis]